MAIIEINSVKNINEASTKFLSETKGFKKFAFYGEMGVGKTTFIKAICHKLKVKDIINSPSFAIINEYYTINDDIIYHFDFYRIKNIEEVYDFGYEDYFFSDNYCFIEWAEKIEKIIPPDFVKVYMTKTSNNSRKIEFL
ncbi:MAG: tRNA (adenosine(37)-N6)-threonylcarbamoyltransferase complex ATPase subunit type 1 TsaE [Bacteroidales bacterium]|nr:tRNA (adenosine(37)-N6)-threonylcarbamoyltransferase complex ATPase subunit type 1 TsaE [Bacteroidales bacterium]